MSVLTYNGVTLGPYGLVTSRVAFEPQYDPSGSDYLFTEVNLSLVFVLADSMAPALSGESPATAMARIQHMLQVPRRGLLYKAGTDTLVSVVSGGNTALSALDAKNGPIPGPCYISRVEGDKAFRVAVSYTARIVDCPEAGTPPLYVSHRYTETIDINRYALSRRSRTGLIITRSDMVGNSPDSLRGIVAPSLEPQFLRISSQYTLAPDGLSLSYSFVDEEQFVMPPDPAAEAVGSYFEFTEQQALRFGEVQLMLRAGKADDKGVLLAMALAVAMAKLESANPVRQFGNQIAALGGTGRIDTISPPILAHAAIREKMYENEVEVRLRSMLKPLTKRFGIVNTDLSRFSSLPFGSRQGEFSGFDPGLRGTAGLLMIAAVLQDPCLRQTVLTNEGQAPDQPSLRGTTVPANVSISNIPATDEASLVNQSEPGIYTHYSIRTRDVFDNNTIQMPVGKEGAPAVVIQTGAATQRRVYEWTAEKLGTPPRIPNPFPSANSNSVVAELHRDPGQVEVMPDGETLKYICSGRYEYFFKDPSKVSLAASVPPWMSEVALGAAAQPFAYSDGIIDINANGSFRSATNPFGGQGGQTSLRTIPGLPNLENG